MLSVGTTKLLSIATTKNFSELQGSTKKEGIPGYRITANASDATLLPVEQRTCRIPRIVTGGMGQSNVWYADTLKIPLTVDTRKRVKALVAKVPAPAEYPRTPNLSRNARVEESAISVVRKHYESCSYKVASVEKDNCGWDLEASSGTTKLRIEVKGLSGSSPAVQLTPNEYQSFQEQADDYRLAIVTNALSAKPSLSICRYSKEQGCWVIVGQQGAELEVKTRASAIVRI